MPGAGLSELALAREVLRTRRKAPMRLNCSNSVSATIDRGV